MQNSEQIFSIALGLQEPWIIKRIVFNKETSHLDIHLEFTKGYKFTMEDDNYYTAHDIM